MSTFTIYDLSTGKVKKVVDYPKAHVKKYLSKVDTSVYGILEGEPPNINGYIVVEGKFVRDEEYFEKESWEKLRLQRNALLKNTDFFLLEDAPGDKNKWKEYRKELRELPNKTVDPKNPVWPKKP